MAAITDIEIVEHARPGALGPRDPPDEPPPSSEEGPTRAGEDAGLFPAAPTEWLRRWLLGEDLALSRWLGEEEGHPEVPRGHERALRSRRVLAERIELRRVRHQLEMARRALHRVPRER